MSKTTEILAPDDAGIAQAAEQLRQGALVAFPTETVYGLGADARNGQAVAAIYEAKGRPSFNPLIVHVTHIEEAQRCAVFSDAAIALAQAFWPGPLTLVLPLRVGHGLSSLVTAGLDTVALRVPAHGVARALLKTFSGPLAAPSANPSGRISATTPDHVMAGLSGKIASVLDGGPCPVGVESTIIGLTDKAAVLLRAGGIPTEALEAALGQELRGTNAAEIIAPGQLASHYAPAAKVRLEAKQAQGDEVLLGFGAMACDLNLSKAADLHEAAANLFAHLHRLDALARPIAVVSIPDKGLGRAINDRLRRAAAPR